MPRSGTATRASIRSNSPPRSFVWRGKAHRITTILKRWIVRADWWRQEISRQYYKVECDNLGTYEIYQERDGWFLERLYD